MLQRLDARLFKFPAAVRASIAQVKSFAGPTLALEALRFALHRLPPEVQERFRPVRRGEGGLLASHDFRLLHGIWHLHSWRQYMCLAELMLMAPASVSACHTQPALP